MAKHLLFWQIQISLNLPIWQKLAGCVSLEMALRINRGGRCRRADIPNAEGRPYGVQMGLHFIPSLARYS